MDRVCAKCGKPLQPDQAFCEGCGTAWTASVAAQPVAGGSSSTRALLVAAIAVVALGIVGVGGWLSLRSRADAVSPSADMAIDGTSRAPAQPAPTVAQAAEPPAPSETASPAVAVAVEGTEMAKACSLVTPVEMAAILGSKVVKITATALSCSYFTDETKSAQVETTWTGGKDALAEVKGFNSAPGLFEPIVGIGDEAYMQAAGVLHLLKGDTYVVVNSREYPQELETESAIARKVLEHLT